MAISLPQEASAKPNAVGASCFELMDDGAEKGRSPTQPRVRRARFRGMRHAICNCRPRCDHAFVGGCVPCAKR